MGQYYYIFVKLIGVYLSEYRKSVYLTNYIFAESVEV